MNFSTLFAQKGNHRFAGRFGAGYKYSREKLKIAAPDEDRKDVMEKSNRPQLIEII